MKRLFIPPQTKLIPEEAELVFRGKIYDVYQWPQKLYDGSIETFEMLRRPDTVKIIAVLTPEEQKLLSAVKNLDEEQIDDKIVITRQRQPRKDWFYDYPGGRADETDADELAAAKRELREETGLEMRDWKLISVGQSFTKIDWLVYTFLATGLIGQGAQDLDAGEQIEVELATLQEIAKLAESDESQYLRFKDFDATQQVADLQQKPGLFQY